MTAIILNGKTLSEQIRAEIAAETADFVKTTGVTPCLAAVLVGEDPGSQVYVRNKQKACEKAGIASQLHRPPADISTEELLALVERTEPRPKRPRHFGSVAAAETYRRKASARSDQSDERR